MTSQRKLEANRRNALQSTGPRTAAGKARGAARNALRHGFLAREALLPTENRRAFERLAQAFREDWKPMGVDEHFLVEVMIMAAWRWCRLLRMEADILSWKRRQDPIGEGIIVYDVNDPPQEIHRFYIPDNGRGPKPEPDDPAKASAPAEDPPLPIGLAFLQGCGSGTDAFAKLARYETMIQRTIYQARHELQRRQHARRGGHVPPPLVVDLAVSGGAEGEPDNATTRGALDSSADEGARP